MRVEKWKNYDSAKKMKNKIRMDGMEIGLLSMRDGVEGVWKRKKKRERERRNLNPKAEKKKNWKKIIKATRNESLGTPKR